MAEGDYIKAICRASCERTSATAARSSITFGDPSDRSVSSSSPTNEIEGERERLYMYKIYTTKRKSTSVALLFVLRLDQQSVIRLKLFNFQVTTKNSSSLTGAEDDDERYHHGRNRHCFNHKFISILLLLPKLVFSIYYVPSLFYSFTLYIAFCKCLSSSLGFPGKKLISTFIRRARIFRIRWR